MPEVPFPHRREFSRVPVHLKAELTAGAAPRVDGIMENLSLKGGFFRSAAAPAESQRCDIRMHLEGTEIEVCVTRIDPKLGVVKEWLPAKYVEIATTGGVRVQMANERGKLVFTVVSPDDVRRPTEN